MREKVIGASPDQAGTDHVGNEHNKHDQHFFERMKWLWFIDSSCRKLFVRRKRDLLVSGARAAHRAVAALVAVVWRVILAA